MLLVKLTSSFELPFVQRCLSQLGYGNMLFETALETYFSLSVYLLIQRAYSPTNVWKGYTLNS